MRTVGALAPEWKPAEGIKRGSLKQRGRVAYSSVRAPEWAHGRKQRMAVENGSARIGKSVVICGEVKGSEDLIVDGRVEGT